MVRDSQLQKIMAGGGHLYMIQLMGSKEEQYSLCSLNTYQQEESMPTALAKLLEQFKDVFDEPHNLPPSRGSFDHKIPLLEELVLFALGPTGILSNKRISLSYWCKKC